jgi:hypothetical protein
VQTSHERIIGGKGFLTFKQMDGNAWQRYFLRVIIGEVDVSVVSGAALEGTTMTHDGIGVEFAKDEEEISADDILWGVVEIGSVYLRGNLDETAFFLHLRNEVVGCLVGRSHYDFVIQ